MRGFMKTINEWVDKKFTELKKEEKEKRFYKTPLGNDTSPTSSKADWENFYKKIPIIPSDLINK